MPPTISVVIPCYNEAAHIVQLLDAVRSQTVIPTEIVVADCRSTDDTVARIAAYRSRYPLPPLRVISCELRSTPMAVNRAIEVSKCEIIVRLDGHSRPDRDYVERCLDVLASRDAGVVGGIWKIRPGAETAAARAIAVAAAHPFGAGDALYRTGQALPAPKDVDTVPFGCFPRRLWERLGGFDEHFLVNQDYEFNYRVRRAGARVVLDPRIRATYTARATIWGLARQYFRYGWWKGETLKRHPGSLRWRQAVPAVFVAVLVLLAAASLIDPRGAAPLAAVLVVYGTAAIAASAHAATQAGHTGLLLYLPFVFATIHLAWGGGLLTNLLTAGQWPGRVARPRPSRGPTVAGIA